MTSGMEFGRSPPDHHSELSQATQAAAAAAALGHNHPLGVLSNLTALNMNMGLASGLAASGLHHGDVLEKLKMQVRDMKVGALMSEQMAADFAASLHASSPFGAAALAASQAAGVGNGLAMFGVGREMDVGGRVGGPGGPRDGSGASGTSGGSATTTTGSGRESRDTSGNQNGTGNNSNNSSSGSGGNNFSFTLPNAPISKDGNPGSNSSTSSETSNSSQQNNGWSFEEQFKQVRQLYEINDDPKRKEFLDDLFLFMQKRGTPINRLPIMAKSVLDLYELYNLVIARGGLVDVINKKLWQEIIKGLHLPSSITSAAFTLRTQYMKYLYPYECEKKNLSTPAELQAAIDGNRREGRRSSYGQFDSPSVQRSPIPQGMSQIPPMSLVSHVNQQQQQHHHHHHRLLPPVGQIPNILPAEFEQRMLDYIKLFQPKEMTRAQSPDGSKLSALNALEISRVALWNMYNPSPNSPPNSLNTSPENNMQSALDLSESPDHAMPSIKRERTEHPVDFSADPRDFSAGHPPPAKRSHQQQQQQQQQQQHHHHHHHHHSHSRSLTPLKLNSSSHDEDELRSVTGTPINMRENGTTSSTSLHHHEDADEDEDEEEEDEEPTEEDILRASLVASQHHPLALSLADHHLQQRERERVQQHVAAQAAAVQQHLQQQQQQQQQQQHMASLDLSVLDRERVRCGSADGGKLKRHQHQQHDDDQSQHEEQEQQHHQQQQAVHHHNHNHHQRQQQQSSRASRAHLGRGKHTENGDRLSLTPDSDFHHSSSTKQHHGSADGNVGAGGRPIATDPFSSPMGITGMQFKLISRGDASKGDQKLVVTMEFNGVQYEGVLFANPLPLSTNNVTAPTSTPPSSSVSATSASPIGSLVSPVKTSTVSPLEDHRADDRAAATTATAPSSSSNGLTASATVVDPVALPLATNGAASSLDVSPATITSAVTAACSQPQQMETGGPAVPTSISSPLVS